MPKNTHVILIFIEKDTDETWIDDNIKLQILHGIQRKVKKSSLFNRSRDGTTNSGKKSNI